MRRGVVAAAVALAGLGLTLTGVSALEVVGSCALLVVAPVLFSDMLARTVAAPLGPIEREVRSSAEPDRVAGLERFALGLGTALAALAVGAVVIHAIGEKIEANTLRWWLLAVDLLLAVCCVWAPLPNVAAVAHRVRARAVVTVTAAAVLLGGAIAAAAAITQPPRGAAGLEGYTVLAASQTAAASVQIQIRSVERRVRQYRLVVTKGGKAGRPQSISLQPGEQRTVLVHLRPGVKQDVRADLYAPSDGDGLYRTINLTPNS